MEWWPRFLRRSNAVNQVPVSDREPVRLQRAPLRQNDTRRQVVQLQDYSLGLWQATKINAPQRDYLYDLYQQALDYDSDLTALLQIRQSQVQGLGWRLVDSKGSELPRARALLASWPYLQRFLEQIVMAQFWGVQLIWIRNPEALGERGGAVPEVIPHKHVDPVQGMIRESQSGQGGFPYRGFVNYIEVLPKSPTWLGLGLHSTLLWIWQKTAEQEWQNYITAFGTPPVVLFTESRNDDTLMEAEAFLQDLASGGGSYAMFQPNDRLESISFNPSTAELWRKRVEVVQEQRARLILGAEQSPSAQNNVAKNQAGLLDAHVQADMGLIASVMNTQFLRMYPAFNGATFVPERRTPMSPKVESEVIRNLDMAGYRVSAQEVGKRLGYDLSDKMD